KPRAPDRSFFMRALLARFLRDEVGATAIEYAIIAGGISIVIVAGVRGIGTSVSGQFNAVSSAFK
ncbi:Flp family type IVb pilin, partial [Escherichia coli]|nr:Flp family type IVb pilin [Escherichia coli]